jgi:hypothetical protein
MVVMNFTVPSAEYLIPADLKRTTIRQRNPVKEEQIERIKELQHYWKQRTPECKLLAERDLKKLTVIECPIIEFIQNAPPALIYGEGFGFDRWQMELFFVDYYKEKVALEDQFYITEWWPAPRTEGL